MTILYVNGDSYSAPVSEFKVYSSILGEKLSIPVFNNSMPGSSNDRIFRTTVEYVSSLKNNEKPFVIIGFSFITREEVWIDNWKEYKDRINDFHGSQFVTLEWLQKSDITDDIKNLIVDQNINHQAIHFYTKLYMLTGLLKSLGISYLMFSAARNIDFRKLNWSSINNLSLYQHITNDSNIIDFKTFNIPLWAEQNNIKTTQTGHLLKDGHVEFANFIHNRIHNRL